MDQMVAKNSEEIKKLKKEIRSMNTTMETMRQSIDGLNKTLTGGLQRLFSEIETLKMGQVKIKSKLKFVVNSRSPNCSSESQYLSDTDMRRGNWIPPLNTHMYRFPPGNQSFNSKDYRGPNRQVKHSSSDDTDEDRVTIVTDSVEEDTSPRSKKEKRKSGHSILPSRMEKPEKSTSELSSSDVGENKSDISGKNKLSQDGSKEQKDLKDTLTSKHVSSSTPNQPKTDIETDRSTLPLSNMVSNISQQGGGANSSIFKSKQDSRENVPQQRGATGTSLDENLQNGFDSGDESDLDTNIAMEVETKCTVTYPHTLPNYQPVMVDYDKIDFSDGALFLKSLGFHIIEPTTKEYFYKVCALDNKKNEQLPEGLYTLLLLDTSYSTGPGGLEEMRKFVNDFLDEIETATEQNLEEMVGVMEFGATTGVLHEFTNDYSLIRECLDKINKCSGRTHLWSALIGVFAYCHKKAKKCKINGRTHGVRIVLVSDGNMTDEISILSNCENEADLERIEERILKFMPYMLREKMTLSAVEIGMDSEARFLKQFVKKGKGQYGLALWAKYVGRYYLYQTIIGKMLPELKDPKNQGKVKELIQKHTAEFDYFNRTDMSEIGLLLKNRYKIDVPEDLLSEREPLPEYDDDDRITLYTTELFPKLPPIGTRVEKAANFKDRHEEYYKGTVVAHCSRNVMVVKWDEEPIKIHCYKYEIENHEVEIMYEYRQIDMTKPGLIEVGCRVIRGFDWQKGDEDGGQGTMGVVVRKHAKKWVTVKWPNGNRKRYRFGVEGCYDLELVDEQKRKASGIVETVPQWQVKLRDTGEWRTLDEDSNNAVLNYIDTGKDDPITVVHHGVGYDFFLKLLKYEVLVDNVKREGEIRLIGMEVKEQKETWEKEWKDYLDKRRKRQKEQAAAGGGGNGMNFINQMTQGGGKGFTPQMRPTGGLPNMANMTGGFPGQQNMAPGGFGLGQAGMFGGAGGGQGGMFGGTGGGQAGMFGGAGGGQGGMFGGTGGGQGGMFGGTGGGQAGMFGGAGGGQGGMFGGAGGGQGGMFGGAGEGQAGMFGGAGNQPFANGGTKWTCKQCTFENKPQTLQCEMCQTVRE